MHEGGCLCQKVRYRADADPDWPHLCSCPHCQRLSGAPAMAWVDFPLDRFEWVGAEPRWYNTWPTTRRGFCDECGSTIAAIDEDGTAMGVTIMSLDGPTGLVPEHQSFKDNAVSWLPVIGTGSD